MDQLIAKQCPDDADYTKANFDECIKDYLEAVSRFPNIGDQLIWALYGQEAHSHANK
jgi:hypothetical protein